MISYILATLTGVALLVLDQLSKLYVADNFVLGEGAGSLIPGVIDLVFIYNTGGAWGMLSGHTAILIGITAIIMAVCIVLLFKMGRKNKLLFWAIALVLCGGIGNMIDRIFRGGKVVDFLHFTFWPDFPVFNIADIGVVLGAGLLILYFVLDLVKEAKQKKAAENGELDDREI